MIKVLLAFFSLIFVTILFAFYQQLLLPAAKIDNHEFQLLIAKKGEDMQIGLSKYNKLDDGKAMVFIFEKPGFYRFWMKDMKFPIDIIFIKDNKIVTIYKNVPIPKDSISTLSIYSPSEPIDKVLETNSGISDKFGFKIGDKIEFKNIK